MRWVPLLLILLLASGCAAPLADPEPSDPQASDVPPAAPTLHYQNCKESDFAFPIPVDELEPHAFKLRTIDPAGTTVMAIVNAITCEWLDDGVQNLSQSSEFFFMLPVEPLPGLEFEPGTYYVWLIGIVTDDPRSHERWSSRGVYNSTGKVDIAFQDFAGRKEGASTIRVAGEDGWQLSVDSKMTSDLARGRAGHMAMYTAAEEGAVWLHRIEFSDYSYYPGGVGVTMPGAWFFPLYMVDLPQPMEAFHNLDYGVRFLLDQKVRA